MWVCCGRGGENPSQTHELEQEPAPTMVWDRKTEGAFPELKVLVGISFLLITEDLERTNLVYFYFAETANSGLCGPGEGFGTFGQERLVMSRSCRGSRTSVVALTKNRKIHGEQIDGVLTEMNKMVR